MKARCTAIQTIRATTNPVKVNVNAVWEHSDLIAWASSETSSVLVLQGSFTSKDQLRRFSIEICDYLERKQPLIYILHEPNVYSFLKMDEKHLLRQLAMQGLRIISMNASSATNGRLLADITPQIQQASTIEDWFAVLTYIFRHICGLFVIVDVEVLGDTAVSISQTWPQRFHELCKQVNDHTLLRVMLLGSHLFSTKPTELPVIQVRSPVALPYQVGAFHITQGIAANHFLPLHPGRHTPINKHHEFPDQQLDSRYVYFKYLKISTLTAITARS